MPDKSDKIKVGVIGAGRIGKLHIMNIIKNISELEIKTISDVALGMLKKWANENGLNNITLTGNPDDIFNDNEIDAVIICSSTDTHTLFIRKAAAVKKHVFCEKPIGVDINDIKQTLAEVKKAKIKLMIGFNRRFDHNFSRVRKEVESGRIGVPHLIKITSRDPAPPPIEYIKVSGGLFNDMTIHDWDMARYLGGKEAGEITEVYAMGAVLVDEKIGTEGGDIDTCAVVLRYESGAMALIDNSRRAVYGYDQRVEVFGSGGAAIADNDTPNRVKIYTERNTYQDNIPYFFLERYTQSYITEMRAFMECIKNDTEPPVTGYDGLMAVVIARAALKSLRENRPVKIKELLP